MRLQAICFLAMMFTSAHSQTLKYKLQLFYNINEYVSQRNNNRVDSFYNTLPKVPAKVTITGYTDFLHNTSYNASLSQKRADVVKDRLLKLNTRALINIISCSGSGEAASADNHSKLGEPGQRRVDVVVEVATKAAVVQIQKPKPISEAPKEEKPAITLPKLEKLKKGESFALEGLSFEPGRHVVLLTSMPVLRRLLETLESNPTIKIEIQGHICCTSGTEDGYDYDSNDDKLSENRAKAVYNYLVKHGIAAERLIYKGFGHSKPKVREINPATEQINRRVEIKIVEAGEHENLEDENSE